MPIDPSIILNVRPPQIQAPDPLGATQKSLALKALMGQGELQALQVAQARQAQADDASVREAYRTSGGNYERLFGDLSSRGLGKQAEAVRKAQLEARNTEAQIGQRTAAANKSNYDIAIDKLQRGASIMSTAVDQPSYDAARRQLALTLGPEIVSTMPEQFDPRFVASKLAEAQTYAQRLADQRAREAMSVTMRGQDMTAKTAEAGQRVTMRGQDIGAQTAREGHGVTMRGQDISAATTRRGQDLTNARALENNDPAIIERRAAATARGKEIGESTAQAQINLPQAIDTANRAIRLVDELVTHPGFRQSVGFGGLEDPLKVRQYVPGTDSADFKARMNELKGGAFLQAFESLKGGGQITEVEGRKATEAIMRMDTAQSEKEFRTAAKEFQDIARAAVQRAQTKAGVPASPAAAPAQPAQRATINPARLSDAELLRELGRSGR